MMDNFYKNLLFDPKDKEETAVRLLIFGNDEHAVQALKQAFSCGQLPGRVLHIAAAVPGDRDNARRYRDMLTEQMPALPEFAKVGEKWCKDAEIGDDYADISVFGCETTKRSVMALLNSYKPTYVIVSLGDDSENVRVGRYAVEYSSSLPVCYVCSKRKNIKHIDGLSPILPVLKLTDIDPELYRMAFNSHFAYSKGVDERKEMQTVIDEFCDIYNFDSSCAYALHLKYKLRSVGIEPSDPAHEADKFIEKMKSSRTVNELAYYEHRRWCAYTITDGFVPLPEDKAADLTRACRKKLTETVGKKTFKYHAALKKSKAGKVVLDKFDWDNGDIDKLDDLDRMSVLIYRAASANRHIKDGEINKAVDALKDLDEDHTFPEKLEDLEKNIDLIMSGNKLAAANLDTVCSHTIEELRELYLPDFEDKYKAAEKKVGEIKTLLFNHVESLRHYDYKDIDFKLIKQIPLILKYRSDLVLVQKLRSEYTNSRMQVIKAAIDLEPKVLSLVSVINCSPVLDIPAPFTQLKKDIERYGAILRFKAERAFCGTVELNILVHGIDKKHFNDTFGSFDKELERLCSSNEVPIDLIFVRFKNAGDPWDGLMASIGKRHKGKGRIVNGMSEDSVGYRILSRADIPDLNDMRCCLINKNCTVEEHMILHNAEITSFNVTKLEEYYKKLWGLCHDADIYAGCGEKNVCPELIWNNAIAYIAACCKKSDDDTLGYIPRSVPGEKTTVAEIRFLSIAYTRVKAMLDMLKNMSVISGITVVYGGAASDITKIRYRCSDAEVTVPVLAGKTTVDKVMTVSRAIEIVVSNIVEKEFAAIDTVLCEKVNNKGCIRVKVSHGSFTIVRGGKSYNPTFERLYDKLAEFGFIKRGRVYIAQKEFNIGDMDKKERGKIADALKELEKKEGIVCDADNVEERVDDNKVAIYVPHVNYTFAHPQLKEVLTKNGTILEVFIYFALKNIGYFTDVMSNVKIAWRNTADVMSDHNGDVLRTNNEIDAAATKGSIAALISAKLRKFNGGKGSSDIVGAMYEIKTLGTQFGALPIFVSGIPDAIDVNNVNRADRMDEMELITREEYACDPAELSGEGHPYDLRTDAEEKKLGDRIKNIFEKYI